MDAGFGENGTPWERVQPALAKLTRACVYDRAGLGYSSPPAAKPHSNQQMARELHTLLERARIESPYVLVGHSMGGINIRLFAREHPAEVSGMVLVDSAQDPLRTRALLSEAEMAEFRAGMLKVGEGIDADTLIAGAAEVRASGLSLGDKPLVVLTRGKEDARPGDSPERTAAMLRAWQEVQAELPRLSTNAVQVVAADSHHFIQWDAPKLVIAAIVEVVTSARTHAPLSASALTAIAKEHAP